MTRKRMSIGKHRGKLMSEVPLCDLQYYLGSFPGTGLADRCRDEICLRADAEIDPPKRQRRKKESLVILEGPPKSTQSIYKVAHKRVTVIYMTVVGKKIKESYQLQAKAQYKGKPISGQLEIDVKLYFHDKRIRDWDNYHKLSMDALTGIVWDDDNQIKKATVEKFYDKKNPRIEITVEPL